MQRFDVLVVGGGPAGSTTAYRLAEGGASVLLVDRARFPRDKPCGGGMTMRAVRECPVDPSPVVEEEVDIVELRFRYGDSVVRRSKQPVIRMTQRRVLDAFLLDAARERGVEVREGAKVVLGDRVTVDGEPVAVDVVVGADGANGTTARALGLGEGIVHGVAYEGNVPYGVVSRERYGRRAVVELADIPGGYGWVFAKGDHVNVGVGAWQSEGPKIREHLTRLCEAHSIDESTLEGLRGHRLPLRRPGTPIAVGARAARRRRGRADRPGLRRRHVRVLRLVAARGRRHPRPARRPRVVARAVRDGRRHGADAAAQRVVAAQAGARPLAARLVARRAHASSCGAASSGCCTGELAHPGRAARPGARPAPRAVSPRPVALDATLGAPASSRIRSTARRRPSGSKRYGVAFGTSCSGASRSVEPAAALTA